MGETSYILIIPVVFGWWRLGEYVGGVRGERGESGMRRGVGGLPCKAQSS